MRNAVIASTAVMATSALAKGTAHVVNACKYDVHMCNTPAQGGGYSDVNNVLKAGDSYSQAWTELGNGMGWSIKLAKTPSYQTNLLQYEYTFHNDGTIWYDLSQVDGNPWDGDWMITATGDCNPKQQAYRYATDDAYGMQSCGDEAEITVTLCSGEDQADGAVSSASAEASSPAETPDEPAPISYAQAPTTEAEPRATKTRQSGHGWTINDDGFVGVAKNLAPSPTTLVTKQVAASKSGDFDVTVTNVETVVETAYVTAGAKRHEHHPRHPHQVRQE